MEWGRHNQEAVNNDVGDLEQVDCDETEVGERVECSVILGQCLSQPVGDSHGECEIHTLQPVGIRILNFGVKPERLWQVGRGEGWGWASR